MESLGTITEQNTLLRSHIERLEDSNMEFEEKCQIQEGLIDNLKKENEQIKSTSVD